MTEETNKTPSQQEENKEENIFIANPEPPKEAKKSIVATEIIVALVVTILLISGILVWSFVAGNNSATQFKATANKQISSLPVVLTILQPDSVVNNRNLEPILQKLEELERPNLNNVFFASTLSTQYRAAEETSKQIQTYYKSLQQYLEDAILSVEFNNQINQVKSTARDAEANAQVNNSGSLRSLAGTFGKLEQQVLDSSAPPQFQDLQAQIAELYDEQADNYQNWAEAVERNKSEEIAELQKDIAENNKNIEELTSDKTYTEQFEASYKNLEKQQNALEKRLSS